MKEVKSNPSDTKPPEVTLQDHMIDTYRSLRWGLAAIGFAFPILLPLIGWLWYNIPWRDSLSAYYSASAGGEGLLLQLITKINIRPITDVLFVLGQLDGEKPMRSWFVGFLFVMGFSLYFYKGFSDGENKWLNAAGVFTLGVALFPAERECTDCHPITVHHICAVVAFVCIGVVAMKYGDRTLKQPPLLPERKRAHYFYAYRVIACLILLSPFIASIVAFADEQDRFIFWIELFGLWIFSAYWTLKSKELLESRAKQLDDKGLDSSQALASNVVTSSSGNDIT